MIHEIRRDNSQNIANKHQSIVQQQVHVLRRILARTADIQDLQQAKTKLTATLALGRET